MNFYLFYRGEIYGGKMVETSVHKIILTLAQPNASCEFNKLPRTCAALKNAGMQILLSNKIVFTKIVVSN